MEAEKLKDENGSGKRIVKRAGRGVWKAPYMAHKKELTYNASVILFLFISHIPQKIGIQHLN